ncbi:SusD family protein [compost metagenome]
MLLIYAEAANRAENGVSAAALEALNKVRRRAYGYDPAVASVVDYTIADYATTPFLDLVMKERVYEFAFEGKRWLELKRTGKTDELVLANKGKTIAPKHLLWPIPLGEIDYNDALNPLTDQNPGY